MQYVRDNYIAFFGAAASAAATVLALTGGTFTLLLQQVSQSSPTSVRYFPRKQTIVHMAVLVFILIFDGLVLLLLPGEGIEPGARQMMLLSILVVLNALVPVSVVMYVLAIIPWLTLDRTVDYVVKVSTGDSRTNAWPHTLQALEELAVTILDKGYRTSLSGVMSGYAAILKARRGSEADQRRVVESFSNVALMVVDSKLYWLLPDASEAFWVFATCLPLNPDMVESQEPDELWLMLRQPLFRLLENGRESEFGRFLSKLAEHAKGSAEDQALHDLGVERVACVALRMLHASAERGNGLFVGHALEALGILKDARRTVADPYATKALALVEPYRGDLFNKVAQYRKGGSHTVGQMLNMLANMGSLGMPVRRTAT